jgi:hypothetical protein
VDLDPRAPIVEGETFTLVAALEVRKAVRLQYYVSLLAIQADFDEPGQRTDWLALHRLIADVIRGQVRSTDVISVMPTSAHVGVLLVGTYLDELPVVIERIAGAVNHHAFKANGRIGRVTLSMGGACFPTTAHGAEQLFHQATSLCAEARRERGPGHRYRLAQVAS